jgi:hypothetical protein
MQVKIYKRRSSLYLSAGRRWLRESSTAVSYAWWMTETSNGIHFFTYFLTEHIELTLLIGF